MTLTLDAGRLQRDVDAAMFAAPARWSPGRRDAWWWLGIPLVLTPVLLAIHAIAPDFYVQRVLPEGYGYLEVSHFFVPLIASIICFNLLRRPFVKSWPLVFWASLLFGLACFFIAGEEHSWGQHFFHWRTPEYWADLNRQKETNLHNTARIFNQIPEKVLQFGILIGGIMVPLWRHFSGTLKHWFFELFTPPLALLPVALAAAFFYFAITLHENVAITLVPRPSEAAETFYYLFLLFYVIVFSRRVGILEARQANATP